MCLSPPSKDWEIVFLLSIGHIVAEASELCQVFPFPKGETILLLKEEHPEELFIRGVSWLCFLFLSGVSCSSCQR